MLQALAVLTIYCSSCGALRPTYNEQAEHRSPGGTNDTEILAVGHSASLQRSGQRMRPPEPEASAQIQLAHSGAQPRAAPPVPAANGLKETASKEVPDQPGKPDKKQEAPVPAKVPQEQLVAWAKETARKVASQAKSSAKEIVSKVVAESSPPEIASEIAAKGIASKSRPPAESSKLNKKQEAPAPSRVSQQHSTEIATKVPEQASKLDGKREAPVPSKVSQEQVFVIPKVLHLKSTSEGREYSQNKHVDRFADVPQYATPNKNPLSQLLGDEELEPDTGTHKGPEVTGELDDMITDITELARVFCRRGMKLYHFAIAQRYRHMMFDFAVYAFAIFLALGLYFMWFQHREVPREQEFRHGLCECFGDFRICFCGFCCPAVRWADTVSEEKGGSIGFVPAFLVMIALTAVCWQLVTALTATGFIAWIALTFIGMHYRQQIRQRAGIQNGTVAIMIEDFFTWFCCGYCAIIQEAREVDALAHVTDSDAGDSRVEDSNGVSRTSSEKSEYRSRTETSW